MDLENRQGFIMVLTGDEADDPPCLSREGLTTKVKDEADKQRIVEYLEAKGYEMGNVFAQPNGMTHFMYYLRCNAYHFVKKLPRGERIDVPSHDGPCRVTELLQSGHHTVLVDGKRRLVGVRA